MQRPNGTIILPFKSTESNTYGTDILIQGNPSEDQRSTKIAVASTGTLYAAFLISNGGLRVARSEDNGTTWTHSATLRSAYYITAVDLTVTGADAASLNVWVVSSGYLKSSIDMWDVSVEKLNQNMSLLTSTSLDQMLSNYGFFDVAIATDFAFPSAGASPFSIGIVYSKIGAVNDNVIFRSSADGGNSFTGTRTLASSGHYYGNVALAFGRSPALPEGRYFAAWDKQPSFSYYGSYFGKIYTSHTTSQFNGAWSAPVRLDTIGGGFTDGAKDPSIACQADLLNNSSNAFSVVVTYDKMLTASGSHTCVYGAGNLNPVGGNAWSSVFSSGTGNILNMESDVTYDPVHQKFYVTWSDSLNAKLKCAHTRVNLTDGGSWISLSNGYNDAANIQNPFPRVKVNPVTSQVVNVWNSQRDAMTANATFDLSDFPVGIQDAPTPEKFSFSISPNPCHGQATLTFNSTGEEAVSVNVYDLLGNKVSEVPSQTYPSGSNRVNIPADQLQPACYLVQVRSGSNAEVKRLIVIH
jgi:hypothetical protein